MERERETPTAAAASSSSFLATAAAGHRRRCCRQPPVSPDPSPADLLAPGAQFRAARAGVGYRLLERSAGRGGRDLAPWGPSRRGEGEGGRRRCDPDGFGRCLSGLSRCLRACGGGANLGGGEVRAGRWA